jgi:hypothetical protein
MCDVRRRIALMRPNSSRGLNGLARQADDAVDLLAQSRQHEHGDLRTCAQVSAQLQTIFARQHQIEHDEIHVRLLQHSSHGPALADG